MDDHRAVAVAVGAPNLAVVAVAYPKAAADREEVVPASAAVVAVVPVWMRFAPVVLGVVVFHHPA